VQLKHDFVAGEAMGVNEAYVWSSWSSRLERDVHDVDIARRGTADKLGDEWRGALVNVVEDECEGRCVAAIVEDSTHEM
jgi:hypothetical protein